jgi:hypothetical protein
MEYFNDGRRLHHSQCGNKDKIYLSSTSLQICEKEKEKRKEEVDCKYLHTFPGFYHIWGRKTHGSLI